MPAGLRACVHEFGSPIVKVLLQAGVTKPAIIRDVVQTIWMGARGEQNDQRARGPQQDGRYSASPVAAQLDWLLLQSGSNLTAATLLRVLWSNHMVIVPREPSTVMVAASMDAVNHMGIVSKSEKHRNRLRAAISACAKRLWPQLQ